MKKRFIVCILSLSLFVVSGCAKKDSTLPPTAETNVETGESEITPSVFFTQGAQTNDEEIPWNYKIDPEQNKINIEWLEWIEVEVGDSIELHQKFIVHTAGLLTFSQSDSEIEFSYLDEEDVEVSKTFEILSDSIVQDEENRRYEWLRPFDNSKEL